MERVPLVVGAAGAQVKVKPLMRAHPESTDYWDGSWIDCLITASAGGFRAEYTASLRAEEFARFGHDLVRLHRELVGCGGLKSMEEWLTIEVTGNGRGQFNGHCRLRDRAGDGNTLLFEIDFDQTDIPSMLQRLREIEEDFPIVGNRAG